MKLLFKQRFFSWFDSYDIYDEEGNTVFAVQGKLDWGHRLEIYDHGSGHLGTVKEKIFTLLPCFDLYIDGHDAGRIQKEFTLFRPAFTLDCNGWEVRGDLFSWDYEVRAPGGGLIMSASKQLLNWTDTYALDVINPKDALLSVMIVIAIDAAKCSRSK